MAHARHELLEKARLALSMYQAADGVFDRSDRVSVFRGADGQSGVMIATNGQMVTTVPLAGDIKEFSIKEAVVNSDGNAVWQNASSKENPCGNSTGLRGCRGVAVHLSLTNSPVPGNYKFIAQVEDLSASTRKSYVVNFSVK